MPIAEPWAKSFFPPPLPLNLDNTLLKIDAASSDSFFVLINTCSFESTLLINVTEDNLEHTANCAYEFTFFIVSMGILIFLKAKGEKLFSTRNKGEENVEVNANGEAVIKKETFWEKVLSQKWKILAAIFETIGQATYLFALSDGGGIAAVILGAGTVIFSFIFSRIFLKEKLTQIQYIFIFLIFAGILMLSFM